MSNVYGGRHALRSSVIGFRARVALAGAAAPVVLIAMVSWIAAPANAAVAPIAAAPAPVPPQRLTDQVANCQDDAAAATTAHVQAWAQDCLAGAKAALAAWVKAHPAPPTGSPTASPTVTPTATHTAPPTTAPPTTVPPTTTPPATGASFLTGPAGGVGPAAGTVFKALPAGGLQTGGTYDGYAIPGGTITQSGITLRNCTIGDVIFTGNDVTLDHCAVNGGVSISGGDDFVLTRNDITNWSDGIHITSDSGPVMVGDVEDNWVHAIQTPLPCADHADGVQILGATTVMFARNVIDLGAWQSCGSDRGDGPKNGDQCELTQGDVDGIIWDSNLLNGGGIIMRVYGCKHVQVINNKFGNDFQFSEGDTFNPDHPVGVGFVWSGNTNFYSGAVVARS